MFSLRLIKSKHLNGDFDSLTKRKKNFISLFDGLTEEKAWGDLYFKNSDGKIIIEFTTANKSLWLEDKMWEEFKLKNKMTDDELRILGIKFFRKHFNIILENFFSWYF